MSPNVSEEHSSTAGCSSQAHSQRGQELIANLDLLAISTAHHVDTTATLRSEHGSIQLTSPTSSPTSSRCLSVLLPDDAASSRENDQDSPPPLDSDASDAESEGSLLSSASNTSTAESRDNMIVGFAQPLPRAESYMTPPIVWEKLVAREHDRGMEANLSISRWLRDGELTRINDLGLVNTSLPVRFHVRYST